MYKKFLNSKAIFFDLQTLLLVGIYLFIRILSFFLVGHIIIQALLIFTILMIFGALYFKNQEHAWYILLAELFLGGAGHFFEFFGLSMRTIFLITFIILWIIDSLNNNKRELLHFPSKLFFILTGLSVFIIISTIIGIFNHNGLKEVVQDLIPYGFFLLILPAYHIFKKEKSQEFLVRLMTAFLIGSSIFSAFTLFLFSSGLQVLQSPYYKWFRDVAMGKITDMGNGFFRIVTPEHLLVIPIIILVASLLMRKEKHNKMWWFMIVLAIFVLVLNLSRIYILAILVGLVIIKYKHNTFIWLKISSCTVFLILLTFFTLNFTASSGTSLGLDILTGRAKSIIQPSTEVSSYTRVSLLEPIYEKIKENPIIGSGLGSKITFKDPVYHKEINTSQFDWGYLEMIAELGFIGFILFMSVIFYTIFSLTKKIRETSDYNDFYVGVLGGLISILIVNLTAPALFHSLGIFYLSFVIVISIKHPSLLTRIITIIYRVFNRLSK
jgi:O-antigen ligase